MGTTYNARIVFGYKIESFSALMVDMPEKAHYEQRYDPKTGQPCVGEWSVEAWILLWKS